jgi:low affinity Fe/Cu permease
MYSQPWAVGEITGLCEIAGMKRETNSSVDGRLGGQNCVGFRGSFRVCAQWIANATGSPWAFLIAIASVIVWGLTGPVFHFSDTWQLVINTATTIITFLMVFLIQNTQNRDTKALHLKLDELLRGVGGARTSLVNLENLGDEELERLQKQFERIKRRAENNRPKLPQSEAGATSVE